MILPLFICLKKEGGELRGRGGGIIYFHFFCLLVLAGRKRKMSLWKKEH